MAYFGISAKNEEQKLALRALDNDKPIERKKVVPPKSHPWRKNMMLR